MPVRTGRCIRMEHRDQRTAPMVGLAVAWIRPFDLSSSVSGARPFLHRLIREAVARPKA